MTLSALDRPGILYGALIYLAVVVAIGVWASRRTRNARDFFIAGQSVGIWVIGLGTMSAAFSGFVFLGGPGLTYRIGLGSLFIVLPLGFTAGMLCWVLGSRLRAMAGAREIYTLPDVLWARYESRRTAGLAAAAIVLGSVAYLGLQLKTLGIVLRAVLGWDSLVAATLVGLAVIVFYSVAGGMVAGAYTDVAQGGLMLVVAVAIFTQAVRVSGGWHAMTSSIADSASFGPAFLEPVGIVPAFTVFGFFFVFGVGVLGQPHMLHKFFMIDDPAKLRWMPAMLGLGQAVCVLPWLGIGLAVPALVATGRLEPLASADDAAPLFLLEFCPTLLAGLAVAGILAAVMSTADSFLNIAAAALARDLPRAMGRPLGNELAWGRWASVGVAALAVAFALASGELIALLGTFAFGTFGAALAPALAVGLCWDRVPAAAASASILTGAGLNVALELLARQETLPGLPLAEGVPPSAVALAGSFVVLFAVTWWTGAGPLGDGRRVLSR